MPWAEVTRVSLREEFVQLAMQPNVNRRELWRRFGVSRASYFPRSTMARTPTPRWSATLQVLQNLRVLQNACLDPDFVLRGVDCPRSRARGRRPVGRSLIRDRAFQPGTSPCRSSFRFRFC